MKARPHAGRLLASGVFALVSCPALVFSARIVPGFALGVLVTALAAFFLISGLALVLAAALAPNRGTLPPFSGYLVLCAVVVCSGGLVLAFARDATVFLSTLVGALVAIVVTKLEILMKPVKKSGPRKRRRSSEVPGTRTSRSR